MCVVLCIDYAQFASPLRRLCGLSYNYVYHVYMYLYVCMKLVSTAHVHVGVVVCTFVTHSHFT